jgi:hypothetical protein
MEEWGLQAIKEGFPKELKAKRLLFAPVDAELPENRHYIRDYRLDSISLVAARYDKGKQVEWKNLKDVWFLLRDRKAFSQYVRDEVGGLLRR